MYSMFKFICVCVNVCICSASQNNVQCVNDVQEAKNINVDINLLGNV